MQLTVLLAIAATYPFYLASLPGNVPIINTFPSVRSAVTILVFTTMAVGLNVVVGYAGLLDLGFVSFYGVGALLMPLFAAAAAWITVVAVAVAAAALATALVHSPRIRCEAHKV